MKIAKLIVCSLLIGIVCAKPVDNEPDYRQYQTQGSNSYSNPSLSGSYGISQGSYSGYPIGYTISQPMQPLNSYSFGFPGYGALSFPGYSGFPNLFG